MAGPDSSSTIGIPRPEIQCKTCGSTQQGPGSQGAKYTCRGCGTGVDENGYPDMVGYINQHHAGSPDYDNPSPVDGMVRHPETGNHKKTYDTGFSLEVEPNDVGGNQNRGRHDWYLTGPSGERVDSGIANGSKGAEQDGDAAHYRHHNSKVARMDTQDNRRPGGVFRSTGSISEILAEAGVEDRRLKLGTEDSSDNYDEYLDREDDEDEKDKKMSSRTTSVQAQAVDKALPGRRLSRHAGLDITPDSSLFL